MAKVVEYFAEQLKTIQYGTISPGIIDTVRVNTVPIKHLGWTTSDSKRVIVQPHDPQMLGAIDAALKQAGFNSYVFSKTQVVVSVSALSGEQREKVKLQIGRLAEEARVAVRNVRRKHRTKDNDKPLQQLTDKAIGQIDTLASNKVKAL